MPRFENSLSKFIYILVNIFFLIAAPFNLGYFGYQLAGELIPDKEVVPQIAGESIEMVYGSSDNGIYPDEVVINEAMTEPTEVIERVTPEAEVNIESAIDYGEDYSGPITFFLCIDDSEGGAEWTLYVEDQQEITVTHEDIERYNSGRLLIYCQQRVRLDDPTQKVRAERVKGNDTVEKNISMLGSDRYSYLILKYSEGVITYEITEERPR